MTDSADGQDYAARLISEEEGPSSPTVFYVDGIAHIGRSVCVDKRVAGAGLPAQALAIADQAKLAQAVEWAKDLPGYQRCNPVRQAALVSMCYQLGPLADWPKFRAALALGDYTGAAEQMLESVWATQTAQRARREAGMMRTGMWVEMGENGGD